MIKVLTLIAVVFRADKAHAFHHLLTTNSKRTLPSPLPLHHFLEPQRPVPAPLRVARQNAKGDLAEDDGNGDEAAVVDWDALTAELLAAEDEDDGLNDGDWLPDREKARQRNEEARRIYAERVVQQQQQQSSSPQPQSSQNKKDGNTEQQSSSATASRPTPYTDEEEDVIAAMGGKTHHPQRRREQGFLGDSTLQEIATDYSVPISYIADVLCMWGVPVPIDTNEQLGNLVTGEQAFALLEAVNSLDVSQLHDRYSNTNILNLCAEWDMDLRAAFEMCMKEGWSVPFGVRTCLRVEQENELLRVLGDQGKLDMSPYQEEDDDE